MTLSPKEIWQLGFDLNDDVAWRFAPRRLRQTLAAIQDRPDEQPKYKNPEFETAADAFQEAANLFNNYIQSLRPEAQIWEKIRHSLIDLIRDGFVLSVGFPLNGGIVDGEPRHVPLGLWDMRFIYWNKSSVKGLGHEFVSVRVIRTSDVCGLDPASHVAPLRKERVKPGPKSQAPLIDKAVRALDHEGVNLDAKADKEAGRLVRDRIYAQTGKQIEGVRGYGDETIRRRIVAHYKRLE